MREVIGWLIIIAFFAPFVLHAVGHYITNIEHDAEERGRRLEREGK
jgi:hypothetical protein